MLTRRHCLQCSALTAAGEAMAAEPSLAQAIRTADDQARGAAGAWDGPPGREYPDDPQPVSGVDGAKDLPCPCLGLVGEEDHNPSPEEVRTCEALVKPHHAKVEVVSSPHAGHAFVADDRQRYRAEAAKAGWTRGGGWVHRS